MMIARSTETLIAGTAVAVAALGLGALVWSTWKRPRFHRALGVGGGLGIVGGGLVAAYLIAMPTDLIILRGGAPMTIERDALLSDTTIQTATGAVVVARGDETVVDNESDRDVRVETVEYREDVSLGKLGEHAPSTTVRRGDIGTFDHRLNYLGPDDEPPDEITTRIGARGDAPLETFYWLTW
jgi:hypothetical protein